MSNKILMLALVWIATGAQAHAATLNENLASFGKLVTRTISNGREVHLYHWAFNSSVLAGKDSSTPISPAGDYRIKQYLGYLRDNTFRTGNGTGAAGPGIYAAIDPIATCNYGGCFSNPSNPGVAVQFVLTPGVRFLDTLSPQADFPQELESQIAQSYCPARSLNDLFVYASVPVCRQIRDQLISLTGAGALRYSYMAAQFPGCSGNRTAAFVLFGDDAINWNRLTVFSQDLPKSDDGYQENRLIIEALFRIQSPSGGPWTALKDQTPRFTNVAQWMKTNLMGCGNWPEDQ